MSATPSQIKDRIALMCAAVTGITTVVDDWPEDTQPFNPVELPCIIVQVGPVTSNERVNHARFRMVRDYRILILVGRTENDTVDPDTSALEAVEPFLLSIPAYFAQRPRLEHPSTSAPIVMDSTLPADNGTPRIVREGAVYRGAVFTMAVITVH
jgi:hypothetical protein